MTKHDEQWDDLVKGWQGAEFESVSDKAVLQATVKSSGNKILLEIVVNVVAGLSLSAYIIFELMRGLPSLIDVATYSVVLFIALAMTLASVWFRRGNYAALGKDSQSYLQLMLKRVNSTLKLAKTSQLLCAVIFIGFEGLFAALFGFSFLSDHDMAKPGIALAIMAFIGVFFPSMYYFLNRFAIKISAEKVRIEGMLGDAVV
ncbi:MAG: hypothetical protein MJK04_07490 [Psychrosphaera sp.]|nr:hypothetical protein [Psychrosphaera sp.]